MKRTIFKLCCTFPTLSMVKLFKGTRKNKNWLRPIVRIWAEQSVWFMVQSRTDHCYSFDQISKLKKKIVHAVLRRNLFFESIELMISDFCIFHWHGDDLIFSILLHQPVENSVFECFWRKRHLATKISTIPWKF